MIGLWLSFVDGWTAILCELDQGPSRDLFEVTTDLAERNDLVLSHYRVGVEIQETYNFRIL